MTLYSCSQAINLNMLWTSLRAKPGVPSLKRFISTQFVRRTALMAFLGYVLLFCAFALPAAATTCHVTHGVGSGEATTSSIIIWSRTDCSGAYMHIVLKGSSKVYTSKKKTSADSDCTMRLKITELSPYKNYVYTVYFSKSRKLPSRGGVSGKFKTAALKGHKRRLKIVWSGDLAGQDVCRDAHEGFPIAKSMAKEEADVLVLSGDMIYADGICSQVGTYGNKQVVGDFNFSSNLRDFRAHWKYNREDKYYKKLLAHSQALVAWDDHEIVNDAGPSHDTRPNRAAGDTEPQPPYIPDLKLTPLALQTMYEWNPLEATMEKPRHYGSFRYGKNVEIFRIDTRLYRDANLLNETDNFPKTMLGFEQMMWLKQAILDSDATWKIVQSSVPISIPTGSIRTGRDGWSQGDASSDGPNRATKGGFEKEFMKIVAAMKQAKSKNVVFLTADVHFAALFEYPGFEIPNFWEAVVGPMNAGHFLKEEFDKGMGKVKRRFLHGIKWDESRELGWEKIKKYFNYGVIKVTTNGVLRIQFKNMNRVLYQKLLRPAE